MIEKKRVHALNMLRDQLERAEPHDVSGSPADDQKKIDHLESLTGIQLGCITY